MVNRRELVLSLGRLGLASAAAPALLPRMARAQAQPAIETWGKDQLIAHSTRPPDYETPVALLDSWITPIEHHYLRSHVPIPTDLDAAAWKLEIGGEVATPLTLSVDDIRGMPATTATVTLECAGNGRAFFEPHVPGVQWQKGAVGTARWTGVRLVDLLKRAGIRETGKFIVMNGMDRGPGRVPDFQRQVPLDKAMHPETIVAYEMNGVPIPQAHGFPLRAIIPGWEGAYSVKWLTNLTVLDKTFDGFWVASGYRYPTRRLKPGESVSPSDMAPLTGLVVKSLITTPLDGASVARGTVPVTGFAWAGEDDIARVEVSADHGETWQEATLTGERAYAAWRRFEGAVKVSAAGSCLVMARATDSKGRRQPEVPRWNPSGYLWNVPDRVWIEVA